MEKVEDKRLIWVVITLSFLAAFGVYLGERKVAKELTMNGIYVIAKITKPGKLQVEFDFVFQNKVYHSSGRKVSRNQYLGEKVFVNILPYDLNTAKLILDKQVPSCIEIAPYNGWKEIPKDTCSK